MDFGDVIGRRRMVRAFEPDPIDPDAVDRIVRAAVAAPTAGHTRGTSFVVVTDTEQRRAVADAAGEAEWVSRGFDPWLSTAPVHIIVATSEAAYRRRYAADDKAGSTALDIPWWWVDAGAAIEAILLAAVAEGLAAGFLGGHAFTGLETVLAVPDDVTIVGVVTVGRPAPDRRSGSLARPGPTTRIHRERWERR